MPLKVRRLWLSCLVLTAAANAPVALAQQQAENQTPLNAAPQVSAAPTVTANPTATVQQRITKVRAMIAGRNFPGAAAELEKIKKETAADESLQQVSRVMLMGVYLEQPDYTRAQSLLEETFKRKSVKPGADDSYYAVAGQIIKSSQSQLERYKRLGLNLSDAGLPPEACTDLGKWQSLLEIIVNQSKQMSAELKQPDEALTLLEAATSARGSLSRDEYETAKWKNEVNDTRELIANAQMKVSEVDASSPAPSGALIAANNVPSPTVFKQTEAPKAVLPAPIENKPIEQSVTVAQKEVVNQTSNAPVPTQTVQLKAETPTPQDAQPNISRQRIAVNNGATETVAKKEETAPGKVEKTDSANAAGIGTMQLGSLVEMATKKVSPTYPPVAKSARITGIVKVEVVVDEDGRVAEVRNTSGPEMLRRAAMDAIKRWQFKPATRDGQPVKAAGFVNFNFSL